MSCVRMKILQLDVNRISYRLVKPEASVYEDAKEKEAKVENALVVLTTVEVGDTEKVAEEAIDSCAAFAKRQKIGTIVIYPFAHLSGSLEEPGKAMDLFKIMREHAAKVFEGKTEHAPFGWNKQLSMDIKGYPLAEQSRSYGASKGARMVGKEERKKVDLSIVKKSDWAGLPQTDHRAIGEQLNLYSGQEISPGMTYWHPEGWTIYQELVRFIREKYYDYEYEEISTPALANVALWHVSGHYDHYKDNMFMVDYEAGAMGIKPMNCPSTIMIYKTRKRSYRELPWRAAIFDKLYRKEVSGSLGGLFRVQEMTQDDGHIFLADGQLDSEMVSLLRFIKEVYGTFGLKYTPKLSTRDPKNFMGSEDLWEKATGALKKALDGNRMKYELKEGDAAFYGPKIDFDVLDAQGRAWQCATIQLDYQLPLRFRLAYTGEDGKDHTPIMIHRAVFGSLERFIGVMVEHYQGKFPSWLAPVQVVVMSIGEGNARYAGEVYGELRRHRLRARLDDSDRTLEYKIREAQTRKVPYMIVLGNREQEAKLITVRNRIGKQKQNLALKEFIATIEKEILERSNEQAY